MSTRQQLKDLLKKYEQGDITKEEKDLLQNWMQQLEVDDKELTGTDDLKAKMFADITSRSKVVPLPVRRFRKPMVAAAIAGGLLVAGLLGWRLFLVPQHPVMPAIAMQRIENNTHYIKKVRLPDNTVVWLKPSSSLYVDAAFNKSNRLVKLTGEGFFTVKQNAGKPFQLITGQLTTNVLGTSFNVEAYEDETETTISLVEGKVAVQQNNAGNASTLLKPGQMARYTRSNGHLQLAQLAATEQNNWLPGNTVFTETPLGAAIHRLEKMYNLTLHYDPVLLEGKRVTMICRATDSWQTALNSLLYVHDLRFQQKNHQITIIALH